MLDFPSAPAVNQVFTSGALAWRYDGVKWTPGSSGTTSPVTVVNNAALKALPGAANMRVARLGFTAAGDGGYAEYSWSGSNCPLPDDGAQVQPTGVTGCWVADFTAVQPTPMIWGAKGTGALADDDSLAFEAALEAMSGRTLYQGNHSYYLGPARVGGVYFPVATTFKGSWNRATMPAISHSTRAGDPPRPTPATIPWTSYPSLRVGSTVGINMLSASGIDGVLMYRADVSSFPVTDQSAFAGTPLNIAGDNVTIRNSLIMGFAQAIYSDGFCRGTISDMSFDNKANILIANSTDTWQISHIHAWPFAADGPSMGAANWARTGPNFKIRNCNDYTMVSHYLSYGYQKHFVIENNQGVTLLDCDADQPGGTGSRGFEVTGTHADASNAIIAPKCFGLDVGIYRSDTGGANSHLLITHATILGQTGSGIFLDGTNGITQLYSSDLSLNVSAITLNSAASVLDLDGNVFEGNSGAAAINAFNPTDNVIVGPMNRFGLNTETGEVAAGANVQPKGSTISGSTLNLPPVGVQLAVLGGGSFIDLTGGWGGRQVTLIFYGTTTVQATTSGLTTNRMQLRGGVNYVAPAASTMTLLHTGANWIEMGRQ